MCITHSHFNLVADDTFLARTHKNWDNLVEKIFMDGSYLLRLTNFLPCLKQSKTQLIHFSMRSFSNRIIEIMLGGVEIFSVSSANYYLGILIDSIVSFVDKISEITSKLSSFYFIWDVSRV